MTRRVASRTIPEGTAPGKREEGMKIRPATDRDLTAVSAIEAEAFTSPWSRRTFYRLLGQPGVRIWVAASPEDGVVGYAVLWCVLDEAELANLAVREGHRGRGIGSKLLARALSAARELHVRRLHLEVRASNRGAIDLYLHRGFREVGRRKDYYDSPREDALILLKTLDD